LAKPFQNPSHTHGVVVYYLRKGNILWNVRVWGGIKKALKQLPECHTTQ